jgi:hypothetical protein
VILVNLDDKAGFLLFIRQRFRGGYPDLHGLPDVLYKNGQAQIWYKYPAGQFP